MKKIGYLLATALLALTMIAAAPASSIGPFDGGPVIFGGNYTVHSGETFNSDLVVFGGNVTVEEDASVTGSIVIFGGNVSIDGNVEGDLVVIGGAGSLGEKAVVEGDLISVGGAVSRAEGSRVGGDVVDQPSIEIPAIPAVPNVPGVPGVPDAPLPPSFMNNPVGSAFGVVGRAIGIAILAMLLSLFLRPQMERVAQAAVTQPIMAGGVGLMTLVFLPIVMVVMAITLILIPVSLLLVFVMAFAWLFGLVALGMEVGERFTKAIEQTWAPVLTTGFGAFLLAMVSESLALIPCVGWVASALVALVGIGAVALTWFGSRGYPPVGTAPASSASTDTPAVVS